MRTPLSLLTLSALALGTLAATPARAQQLMLASTAAPAVSAPVTAVTKDAPSEAEALAAELDANPISLDVRDGVLSVDGFTARLKLEASIENAAYLSMFIPGTGTVVISLAATPGSELVPNAFHGNRLEFSVAGRDYRIVSAKPMMNRDAYIRLDTSTADLSGQPFISYGAASTIDQPGPTAAGQAVVTPQPTTEEPMAVPATPSLEVPVAQPATAVQGSAE